MNIRIDKDPEGNVEEVNVTLTSSEKQQDWLCLWLSIEIDEDCISLSDYDVLDDVGMTDYENIG